MRPFAHLRAFVLAGGLYAMRNRVFLFHQLGESAMAEIYIYIYISLNV